MNILVTTENIVQIVEDNLLFHEIYGVDTETYGLKWEHDLFLLIIADKDSEYLFNFHPYPDMAPEYILGKQHIPIIDRFFKTKGLKCAHNAKFDMRKLARFGFTVTPEDYYCTYAQERVLKNNFFGGNAYRLEGLAARRGWKKDDKVMEYLKKNKCYTKEKLPGKKTEVVNYHFEKAPFHIMRHYAGVDARLHYDIALDQLKALKEAEKDLSYPSQRGVFFNERQLTGVCFKAEMEGIRIDRDYTQRALEFELDGLNKEEEQFREMTGEKFVDSRVLLEKVFTRAGEAFPLTEKGNASFAGSVLEDMDSPIAGVVNNIRYLDKRINTYYANFLYHSAADGLIHADMRQGGTETGRFSYRDPNLQNLSKEDEPEDLEKKFLIRQCFIPKDGKIFFMLDYRQQEFRMMLDYAGEKKLIADINAGADVHQATADLIGITRKKAKAVNFACIAKDSLVLTDIGLVPIQNVTVDMLVWDGIAFVKHEGVIYNGVKETITYSGIRATKCHKVFTKSHGKITFAEAKQRKLEIFITEHGGSPIRVVTRGEKSIRFKTWDFITQRIRGVLQCMREKAILTHSKRMCSQNDDLSLSKSTRVREEAKQGCENVTAKVRRDCTEVPKSRLQSVQELRWTRNKIKNVALGVLRFCAQPIFLRRTKRTSNRSERQQQTLRDQQSSFHNTTNESIKHTSDVVLVEVYDILNAGPRHRYTVSGHLVSNCLYGAGADKLAKMINVSPNEARQIKREYFSKLQGVKKFIDEVSSKGAARGFIFNWFGRRNHISNSDWSYILPNHLIQGGCADVVKKAMNEADQYITRKKLSTKLLVQVHDELLFEVPPSEVEEMLEIARIMETVYIPRNGMQLTTSMEHSSKSWGQRDKVKGMYVC